MKKKLFKAYYLTCYFLSVFTGIHSMLAEEELFDYCIDYVTKGKEKDLINEIEFTFGLEKKDLIKALKAYKNYKKEESLLV